MKNIKVMHCCRKAIRWTSLPRSGRRTKGKSRCFMWRMTMMPSYQSGFGNVYSLKSNAGKSTWRSMGQTPISTGRKAIHLHPRLFAETAKRYLHEKAGGATRVMTVRYGSAVNATRSKESWDVPTATWRKKR